jgi:3-phosphoshikimate 1-carboxyvinyltransferase
MLLAAPLAPAGTVTELDIPLLNEKPYIEMTLSYLDAQGIAYETNPDFSWFRIPGGASWKPLSGPVPGDFSSAAFPACAALCSGSEISILGLDPQDSQGDKAFFTMLEAMGARVRWEKFPSGEWRLHLGPGGTLQGGTFDLNSTPDLLPVMAVCAAYCAGDSALVNVAHARIKETDRIAVMAEELGKLGVLCEERTDGLVIHGRGAMPGPVLTSAPLNCRGDHRIVMALAAGAMGAAGPVEIEGAESAAVTYPGFLELLKAEFSDHHG